MRTELSPMSECVRQPAFLDVHEGINTKPGFGNYITNLSNTARRKEATPAFVVII